MGGWLFVSKALLKGIWILLLTIVLLGVPRLAGLIADLFNYQAIDPDGSYAWLSMHHIVQALIFMIMIIIISRFKPLDLGFSWGNKDVGRKYVLVFTLIFTAGSLVNHILVILSGSFQLF
jgi:uncharacterized protein